MVAWLNRFLTFLLVAFALVFFRANSLQDAFSVIGGIFTRQGMPMEEYANFIAIAMAVAILFVKESAEEYQWKFSITESPSWLVRHVYLVFMICYIILFGVLGGDQFIYFQF